MYSDCKSCWAVYGKSPWGNHIADSVEPLIGIATDEREAIIWERSFISIASEITLTREEVPIQRCTSSFDLKKTRTAYIVTEGWPRNEAVLCVCDCYKCAVSTSNKFNTWTNILSFPIGEIQYGLLPHLTNNEWY